MYLWVVLNNALELLHSLIFTSGWKSLKTDFWNARRGARRARRDVRDVHRDMRCKKHDTASQSN